MGMVFLSMGVGYAQEENSTRNEKLEVDKPDFVPYKAAWKVVGREHEAVKFEEYDSSTHITKLSWYAMTVYGTYIGAEIGPNFDLGGGVNKFGGTARISIGQSMEKLDLSVSFGVSLLANPYNGGKRYAAMDGMFEAQYNVALWEPEVNRNRFYIGLMAGFGEHMTYTETTYSEPENQFWFENYISGKHSGLTFGASMGYEGRPFISPMRWGVKLSFRTYQTRYTSKLIVNDVVKEDFSKTTWRFVPSITFTMKGVFVKTAQHSVQFYE